MQSDNAAGFQPSPHLWCVPSDTHPGLLHRIDLRANTCTCPGSRNLKHKSECKHIAQVLARISDSLLRIYGEPDAETILDAISALEHGDTLAYRYLCDGHQAIHYGRVPNRRGRLRFAIGLAREARRELSAIERRACIFALRRLLASSQALAAQ